MSPLTALVELGVGELTRPAVGEGAGVLVRTFAGDPSRTHLRRGPGTDRGHPAFFRSIIWEHALPTVVGRDFAGVVEAVGRSVREFAVGDEVFGFIAAVPPLKSGAFAEYVAAGPPRSTCSRRSTGTRATSSSLSARPVASGPLPSNWLLSAE